MKILFVNLSALRFTAATPDHAPLGGSESALCYLARALVERGHDISLTANLPDEQGGLIKNICHFPLARLRDDAFLTSEKFDVIILCNAPSAAPPIKILSPASRIVFWAHALPDQPSMQALKQPLTKQSIDTVVFVSQWQKGEVERTFGNFNRPHVIGNGIAPAFENMFSSSNDLLRTKQNCAAYTTTPYRGLSVLLRAMNGFERVTTLDLFSSMKVYQTSDTDYTSLFDEAAQNPLITLHGSVTQQELAHNLHSHAFLFYPCIYPETFCITAAEAMAAGMKVVSTDLGALSETTMGFADLIPLLSLDGDVITTAFREAMRRATDQFIKDRTEWAQQMFAQSKQASEVFAWSARAKEWENIFTAV